MPLLINSIRFLPCLFVSMQRIWCLPKSVPEIQLSSRTRKLPKHVHSISSIPPRLDAKHTCSSAFPNKDSPSN